MSSIADVPARCPGTNVALADALRTVITWKMLIETQLEYPVSARAWIMERSRCHPAIEVGRPKSGHLLGVLLSAAQIMVGVQGRRRGPPCISLKGPAEAMNEPTRRFS